MDKEIKGRLPPFTEALINHTKEKQFPFDTPGHHGGDFYNLTEEGKAFTRFYGNAMFAADMSDSGNDPGNPSSHEGAAGAAEKLAADTFGADRAWFVLHGTSVSNRICCQALLSENDLVLLDRNSHKSVYQGALLQCSAIPVCLDSLRLKTESSPVSTNAALMKNTCEKKRHVLCRKARTGNGPTALPSSSLPPMTVSWPMRNTSS